MGFCAGAERTLGEPRNGGYGKGVPDIKEIMEVLLQDGSFEAELDERIVFDQLEGITNAVWSLLLAAGYLKVLELLFLNLRY